jgi:hypothetical protein
VSLAARPPLTSAPNTHRYAAAQLLAALDPEDRAIFDGYLADLGISPDKLSAEMHDAGYPISAGAVALYRYQVLKIGTRRR